MSEPEKQEPSFEDRFHVFWLAATPKLFEWFGWIAVLGATQYVFAKTKSLAVLGLLYIGYIALACYTYSILSTKIRITAIKTKHHREFVSGLVALGLAYATGQIGGSAIDAFSRGAL